MQAFVYPVGGGGHTHFFHLRKGPWVWGPRPRSPGHVFRQFVSAMGAVLCLAGAQGSQRFSVRALKGGQVFSSEPSSLGPVVLSNLGAAC